MARQAIPSQTPGSALRFVVSDPGRDRDIPGSIHETARKTLRISRLTPSAVPSPVAGRFISSYLCALADFVSSTILLARCEVG
jgi:hypothetical protein